MCIWFKTDCSRLCFPSAQKVSFPFQSARFFITIKKSFFLQCYQVRQHKIMMTNKILPLLWLNLFGLITLFCGSLLVFLWCNCHFGTENIPGLQIPAPILRDCLPSDSSLSHGFTSSVSRSSTACLALSWLLWEWVSRIECREKQPWDKTLARLSGFVMGQDSSELRSSGHLEGGCGVLAFQGTPSKSWMLLHVFRLEKKGRVFFIRSWKLLNAVIDLVWKFE